MKDALTLPDEARKFKTDHPDIVDFSPYRDAFGMIQAIFKNKHDKKNKNKKKNGGYHETLRNHLRSRRQTYRRV
jgi:hypothetical protein